ATAAAAGAGPLHLEETLPLDDDALAVTPPAGRRATPLFCPAAGALGAEFLARDGDCLLCAAGGFGQIDFEVVLEVAARLRAAAAAAAEQVAEEVAEDVDHRAGVAEVVEPAHSFEAGVAVTVVAGPFVRVAENVVGGGRFLELLLRLLVPDIAIGVILHRQLAVRLGDRVGVR